MVMQVGGTIMSALSKSREGDTLAAASRANAHVSAMKAEQARQAGAYEVKKLQRTKRQTEGLQRARYAKSGVLINDGSPLEVMADTAAQFEMDIRAMTYNTQIEAMRYDYESDYQKGLASRYKTAGKIGAATTLLSGFSKVNWGGMSSTPATDGTGGLSWRDT